MRVRLGRGRVSFLLAAVEGQDAQPTMTVPVIARTPSGVPGSTVMFRVSIIPLKKNGTWTFKIYPPRTSAPRTQHQAARRTFPPTSNPTATSTLVFVPQSSLGQIFGNNVLIISQSLLLCSSLVTS